MTGATFWATSEALVAQDTDKIRDVYEFTESRPQLITSGTGEHDGRGPKTGSGPASPALARTVSMPTSHLRHARVPRPQRAVRQVLRRPRGRRIRRADGTDTVCRRRRVPRSDRGGASTVAIVSDGELGTGGNVANAKQQKRKAKRARRARRHQKARRQSTARSECGRHGMGEQTSSVPRWDAIDIGRRSVRIGRPPRSQRTTILGLRMTPSTTQAGGHPDLQPCCGRRTPTRERSRRRYCECQDPRSIIFDAPAGVIADPHAVPQCNQSDFAQFRCSIDSQVGLINLEFRVRPRTGRRSASCSRLPVYNLTTHPGQAGLFGFLAPIMNSPVFIIASAGPRATTG